ncbi:MAG: chemotaxis protein CheW [Gammaproteobacteria bacterium]|nr:chemotaxis protein CheW [Gammaproteobacteria bacterium]MCP5406438.1 chemotaxis protein CheW [Chromatiaceae bacterium]MCP5408106.1 chemotaxis protein CheW [Chromatiaceae bacterium]MCP5443005.1 chemotaxis protein CheW [Chromatiaceae bacterium]
MSEQSLISPRDLILLLKDMERRSSVRRENLPQQDESYTLWDGIVFNLMSIPVVAQLSDIREIINLPSSITHVPGTRSWMVGIANIRGNLLPITDLQVYLGGKPIAIGKRSRVLVIEHDEARMGLLVGGVQGIIHFKPDQRVSDHAISGALAKYSKEAYMVAKERWPVFDVRLLAEDPEFQMASV